MRIFKYGLIVSMILYLLSACSSSTDLKGNEKIELKVMYASRTEFEQDFQNMIQAKFPNVTIHVIEFGQVFTPDKDRIDSFIAYMKDQKPDLIAIPNHVPGLFNELVKQDLLEPLDSPIQNDEFDIAGLLPGPVEQIRLAGAGVLYALPLTFTSEALFYNKNLFDRYGIPYPKDEMTFADVMKLAQRFTGQKDTFGYSKVWQNEGRLVLLAGEGEKIKWMDAAHHKIIFNTEGWRNVIKQVADTVASGVVYRTAPNSDASRTQNSLTLDPFLKGESAMTIAGPEYMGLLEKSAFQWGLASEPINPVNPGISRSLQPSKVIGITSQSPSVDIAWKVLAFINSDQAARLRSGVMNEFPSDFPVRLSDLNNAQWKSFYYLQADSNKWTSYNSRTEYFTPILEDIISHEMGRMASHEQTIDQMMENIETSANQKWNSIEKGRE